MVDNWNIDLDDPILLVITSIEIRYVLKRGFKRTIVYHMAMIF